MVDLGWNSSSLHYCGTPRLVFIFAGWLLLFCVRCCCCFCLNFHSTALQLKLNNCNCTKSNNNNETRYAIPGRDDGGGLLSKLDDDRGVAENLQIRSEKNR